MIGLSMKILYHHRTQAEDGQAVHIRSLIAAFVEQGHSVYEEALVRRMQAPAGGPVMAPPKPVRVEEQPARIAGGWSALGSIPRFMRELAEYSYAVPARHRLVQAGRGFGAELLYERYAFGNTAGVSAARQLGIPLILEVNSPMVLELTKTRGITFKGLARRTENWVFQQADLVCVVTQVLGDMLVDLGVDPSRLIVTPNGVNLKAFSKPDRERAREQLGLAGVQGPVLGFVGYSRPWHRLDLVVDGLSRPELAQAHLVLIGEGPAHPELAQRAIHAGVSDRVHFAGSRPHIEIPSLLPAFDLGLVPAINPYASPLKLHEYMAAGIPSVVPDQPNLREVLNDGVEAVFFRAEDGGALVEAVIRLVRDPAGMVLMGERAKETLLQRDLTWEGNARRVISATETLK